MGKRGPQPKTLNYEGVKIDVSKGPKKYDFMERRAELLQLLQARGHPRRLNQTQLADRYGVSQGQISQDLIAIKKYIKKNIGIYADVNTDNIYNTVITELLKQNKYLESARVLEMWNNWLFNTGKVKKASESISINTDEGINVALFKDSFKEYLDEGTNKKSNKG